MNNSEFVTNWVLDTVRKDYAEDIALVVSHTTLRLDDSERTVGYFVPITERGEKFGRTFILDGVGYDIWGISWDRLERFAELEEYNITCLADGELLYARTDDDAQRFNELKKRQADRLSDHATMRKNALIAYEQAKKIFFETLFAEGGDVKMGAGYVLDYLAQAIAFTNLRYFRKAQTDQLGELSTMKDVPPDFPQLYRDVIGESIPETQKKLCYEALCMVRQFLQAQPALDDTADRKKSADFQMLAEWYAELSYTWLRIRRYAAAGDAVKTFMWGIMLQHELNGVCDDFGLEKMDLMASYDANRLPEFADRADRLEESVRAIITEGGGIIHAYKNAEEFLHEV